MTEIIDFTIANSQQIASTLARQLVDIRLAHNFTQAELAREAGISTLTVHNLENGQGVSLDTFIRVLIALNLQGNLEALLPSTSIRPIERVALSGKERKRARTKQDQTDQSTWTWGDERGDKE